MNLYLVVTPALCRYDPLATVSEAIAGGVDRVQLREKSADDDEFLTLALELGALCRGHGVPFLLNDRVHLVEAAGADGVHVGEDDMPPEEAREVLGPGRLVGWSTHDRDEVAAAERRGADHVGLGPMFRTDTKRLARTPGGPELVRSVQGATNLPIYPIGGIHAGNLASLVEAGAVRAAVGSAICAAADPRAAAAELRALLPGS